MFNIVKRRDFMLGRNVLTEQEAEKLIEETYGADHIVVRAEEPEQASVLTTKSPD
jgi:hypothetical protein